MMHGQKNIKTRDLYSTFFVENRAVHKIRWTNVQPDRPQMTWRMHIACWILKAT